MGEIKIDCIDKTCPVPLVETRKAIKKSEKGDIIEVKGTHPASKKEIPMAVNSMELEVLSVDQEDKIWTIRIKK